LWSDRALLYRCELGIDVESSAMAVILQPLVEGSRSGIAFGAHPSDPELVAIEAVYGLNQGLVDGTIEPDRWSLDPRSARVVEHLAPPERLQMVLCDAEMTVEKLPSEQADVPPLDESNLSEVLQAVIVAGELLGGAQDVEWTLADGKLVLLQSRPVTTSTSGEGDKRAWYLSLTRSVQNLLVLRDRVECELLPTMDREAADLGSVDLGSLSSGELAKEIERRRRAHDRWVEVYSQDFIPLAHGIRLFGQFYNNVMEPEDPYEFMELLAATPLLSVLRNRELERLASRVRKDPELRRRLAVGEQGDADFERAVEDFRKEFGEAAYASQRCFGERVQLTRLLLSMAETTEISVPRSEPDVEASSAAFLAAVDEERRDLGERLLDLGRASYRLRDDDNIHLARLEALVLDAVSEGRRRLGATWYEDLQPSDLDRVAKALRHPNLVVEPKQPEVGPVVEEGFQALPRQLVGQPAGPGIGSGPARLIEDVEDLFGFQAGEVLVCDAVDPNMTFVVPMACAVVERRGGMLIHGAIIAREYGLPCVTGVPRATSVISNGDPLIVDGYLGIVTVSRS
jgi:pyruvate,water dikinase